MKISATVCDMGGVNRRALSILGASKDTPYFSFENHEVVAIFDPPHLLKSFRNLFMKYDLKCVTNISSNNTKGQGNDYYFIDSSNNIVCQKGVEKMV